MPGGPLNEGSRRESIEPSRSPPGVPQLQTAPVTLDPRNSPPTPPLCAGRFVALSRLCRGEMSASRNLGRRTARRAGGGQVRGRWLKTDGARPLASHSRDARLRSQGARRERNTPHPGTSWEASSEMTEAKQIPDRSRRKEADARHVRSRGCAARRPDDLWMRSQPTLDEAAGRPIEGGDERHELKHVGSGR